MRLNFSFSALEHCFGILLGLVALSLLSADYVSASWSCAVCQNGFNIYGANIQMHTAASVSACAALANTYFQQNYVSSAAAANLTFVYGHYPGSLASNNCVYPVTCTGGLQYTSCNVVNNNVISPNSVARENGAALTMPTPSTGSFSQCNFMYANLIDPYINNFDSFPDLQECWGYCNDNVGSGCVAATATAQPAGGYSCALYRSNIWDQTVLGFGGFFTMIASGLTCPAPAPISNTFHQAQLYGQLYVLGQIPQCVTCSNGFNWNSASLNIQQFSTFDQCAGYAQEQFTTPYYNPFEPSGNTYIFSYGSYPGKTGSNWCAVGVQGCSESLSSSCAATTPYSGAPASANVQLYLLITYPFCPYSLVSCVNSAGTVLQGYCMNPVNGQMYSTFNGGLPTLPANPPLYYRGPTDTSTCASWQGVGGVWAGTAVEPSFPILPHAARGFQLSQNACPTPYQTCIYSNGLAVGYCWNSQYDTYWSTFCDPGTDNSNLCPGGLSTGAIGYVGPLGMTVWNRPRSTQCTSWNTQPCPAGMQTALLTGNTQQTVGLCLNPADNNIYSTYCVAATDNGCHGTFSGTQVSVINGVPMWFRQSNNPQPSWLSSWVATNYDLYSTAAGCGPLANCNSGCPSGYTQSLIIDLCIPSS